MKNKELVELLKHFPPEMDICVFDYKKNASHADGDEGTSEGIYDDFDVEMAKKTDGFSNDFLVITFDSDK